MTIKPPLSPRREKFISAYLRTLNATESAVEAGYTKNRESAQVQGSRLLSDVMVSAEISRRHQRAMKRQELSLDAVLQELKTILYGDVRKLLNSDGTIRPIHSLDDETAATISSLDVVAGKDGTGVAKLRTFDKVRAAELLIKRLSGPEQHLHLVSVFSQEQLETLNEDQLRRVESANLSLVAVKNEVDGTGMKK
tara:strand:+ start:206 stop:790 length:585 start_codon:yes stop_codon:yes gene_type:complete